MNILDTDSDDEKQSYPHTSENIAKVIKLGLEETDLLEKNYRNVLPNITSDCAANELKGVRDAGFESLRCAAHRLRTILEDGYNATKDESKQFERLDRAARKIVRKVKKSGEQKYMQPTLKQHVPTR